MICLIVMIMWSIATIMQAIAMIVWVIAMLMWSIARITWLIAMIMRPIAVIVRAVAMLTQFITLIMWLMAAIVWLIDMIIPQNSSPCLNGSYNYESQLGISSTKSKEAKNNIKRFDSVHRFKANHKKTHVYRTLQYQYCEKQILRYFSVVCQIWHWHSWYSWNHVWTIPSHQCNLAWQIVNCIAKTEIVAGEASCCM